MTRLDWLLKIRFGYESATRKGPKRDNIHKYNIHNSMKGVCLHGVSCIFLFYDVGWFYYEANRLKFHDSKPQNGNR